MSLTAFSKEFTANMFTSVENSFITKYLPWADGDAVRVYLYGLYLCSVKDDFDEKSVCKLLKLEKSRLSEIFGFWEECGLVHILSRDPLFVEYLPVSGAVGKPKPLRAEKYSGFNRELFRLLQRAGKEFKPYELQKILEFLENCEMEQQAFLLVVEYCLKKDGEKLSFSHVMNKASKLAREHKFTYEQVSAELADFNLHEKELGRIFSLLGIYRKPQDRDYDLLESWLGAGMQPDAIVECAASLKKGTLSTLDLLIKELLEKGVRTLSETKEALSRREQYAQTVFAVARKLGVKVQNPRAYIEEYAEKWLKDFSEESLLLLAGLGFKLQYGFAEMDSLLSSLRLQNLTKESSVREYCAQKEEQFKLLGKIQNLCGVVPKTLSSLETVGLFLSRNFSEEMILEAAKRSAQASAPLSYMNRLLSDWQSRNISSPAEILDRISKAHSEAAIAADERTEREHYYALLRQNALSAAEEARRKALQSEEYRLAESAVRKGEIELAKAEVYTPAAAMEVRVRLESAKKSRVQALRALNLTLLDLEPKFVCPKCSDTGFLPDGRLCDCYPNP